MNIGDIKKLIEDGSIKVEQYNWEIGDGNINIEDKVSKEMFSILDLNHNKILSEKVLNYLGIEKYIDNSK